MTPRALNAFLVVVFAAAASPALAQQFPSKPVRIIVHNQAGGPTDVAARTMGPAMSRVLGQPVVVENRPGASGLVAYEFVAKRVPNDGYTLVTGGSQLALLKVFTKDLRFDPLKDLIPISLFSEGPLILLASAPAPFGSFNQFIQYAKANPGKLNWGATGFTTGATLNTFSVLNRYGLDIAQIPLGGNAKARAELLANRIQLVWLTEGDYSADAESGRTKALAVTNATRLPALPDTPTLLELGHPEMIGFYLGYSVPAGTPKAAIDKLYAAVKASVEDKDVKDYFAKNKLYPLTMTPEESARKLASLDAAYMQIAAKAGIVPQ